MSTTKEAAKNGVDLQWQFSRMCHHIKSPILHGADNLMCNINQILMQITKNHLETSVPCKYQRGTDETKINFHYIILVSRGCHLCSKKYRTLNWLCYQDTHRQKRHNSTKHLRRQKWFLTQSEVYFWTKDTLFSRGTIYGCQRRMKR